MNSREHDMPSGSKGLVDLVFVTDTTGSMSDKIDGLLSTCTRFVGEFADLRLDHRMAVVAFGDLRVPGDKIVSTSFTANIEVTKNSLTNIPRYSGGGNEGESSIDALNTAIGLPFRNAAVKVLVLITDEPAYEHGEVTSTNVLRRMQAEELLVFVISQPYDFFQDFAHKNGGRWYRIARDTNFTDLLEVFTQVAKRLSKVVADVHRLADGKVAKYLALKAPKE